MEKSKLLYTGVELDETSREKLAGFCQEGWKDFRHHMTIQFGQVMAENLENWLDENIGHEFELRAVAFGKSNLAAAVEVETEVPSSNKHKHITISINTADGGKPVMSNDITDWEILPEPIVLYGIVKAYTKG